MLTEPTDAMIEATRKRCIAAVAEKMLAEPGAVLNHATIAARLEKEFPEFGYDHRHGDDFRIAIDDSLPPLPVPTSGVLAAIEPADVPAVEVAPEPMASAEEIRQAIHEGELDRGRIRSELYSATAARTIARTILASSLQAFIAGRPTQTPTEVAQSFCAAAAADRQSAKDIGLGHVPAAAVHPRSKLDQQLAYASGGNADDHLRSRFQHGHRRGGVSQAVASTINQKAALARAARGGQ